MALEQSLWLSHQQVQPSQRYRAATRIIYICVYYDALLNSMDLHCSVFFFLIIIVSWTHYLKMTSSNLPRSRWLACRR